MTLKDIMSISGYSGLYKFISQGRNGIIVESLTDGKRSHIPASAKASALSDIAVFTMDGEKPLREVLEAIRVLEDSKPTISHKASEKELKAHFLKVVPNFDAERVYNSDIKKVFSWYNQLHALNILDFSEPVEENAEEVDASAASAEATEAPKAKAKKAPATKTPAQKKAAETKKVEPKKTATKGAAPVKKATVRKKAV
jgi:hypothetical protein